MEFNILIVVSMLVAFVLTLLFGVVYVDFLKKKMYTQAILEDAPENHAKKAGTPTTGGVFIVLPIIFASLVSLIMNKTLTLKALTVLISFLLFMITGLIDDIGKIKYKQNKAGLKPRKKLIFQFLISALPVLFTVFITKETFINTGSFNLELGYLYPVFALLLITGISNAVNLTDGLDGLASSNFSITILAVTFICLMTGQTDLAVISSAAIGSCFAFLYFNKHPAKVFMGDTGSLALGGLLGSIAVVGKFELWILLAGIVFCIETLSVIIQVISFKTTGKRVFKMSPIHHHFELCNWSENKIVIVFSIVSLIFGVISVFLFNIIK